MNERMIENCSRFCKNTNNCNRPRDQDAMSSGWEPEIWSQYRMGSEVKFNNPIIRKFFEERLTIK